MKMYSVKLSAEKKINWPRYCVLCLKENPEKYMESACGDLVFRPPYCQACYEKVERRFKIMVEHQSTINAVISGWLAFIIAIIFLITKFASQGITMFWSILVGTIGMFIGVLLVSMLVISFLSALFEPLISKLLLKFPNRFAKSAVEEIIMTNESGVPDEIEFKFTNQKYANMFGKENKL